MTSNVADSDKTGQISWVDLRFYNETNELVNRVNHAIINLTKSLAGRGQHHDIKILSLHSDLFDRLAEARNIAHTIEELKP